jgi:hypothetical protein
VRREIKTDETWRSSTDDILCNFVENLSDLSKQKRSTMLLILLLRHYSQVVDL